MKDKNYIGDFLIEPRWDGRGTGPNFVLISPEGFMVGRFDTRESAEDKLRKIDAENYVANEVCVDFDHEVYTVDAAPTSEEINAYLDSKHFGRVKYRRRTGADLETSIRVFDNLVKAE